MKHLFKLLSPLFFIILLSPFNLKATHLMGSDITWECIGNDSFEVTLTVYRDCTGIDLSKPDLQVGCKSGGSGNNIKSSEKTSVNITDVTPTCESSCTQCESSSCSFSYGIEKHEITYIVDLTNSNCCKVNFSFSRRARSNSITTGPSGNYYVEAWMDRCAAPCNSSPNFQEDPIALICKNQKFIYNQGATDKDVDSNGNLLDSLSYSFTKPLNNPGNPVNYNSPYSYKEPLEYKGPKPNFPFPYGFHLDKNTGDLKFTPTKIQSSVMAISIDEYRDTSGNGNKDTKISEIRRDLQVFVIDCPNNQSPKIKGMKCPNKDYYEEICAGSLSSFTFCTNDPDKKDSVTLNFSKGNLPGGSFSVVNPNVKHPTGKFKWTPSQKDASETPYQFTVSAKDDNCPVSAKTVESYRIKVKPIPKASYQTNYQLCGRYSFSAMTIEGNNMSFTWKGEGGIYSTKRNFIHQFKKPGEYPYKLAVSANGCTNVYHDTIELDPFLRVNIGSDTTICKGSSVSLGGNAKDNNGKVQYIWHDSVKNIKNRKFKNITKDTLITLTVKDTICQYTDSVKINIQNQPQLNLKNNIRICANDTIKLKPELLKQNDSFPQNRWIYLDGGLSDPKYNWNIYDSSSNSLKTISQNDSILINKNGKYILNVKDKFNCSNNDTIIINENPKLNPKAQPKHICKGDTSTLSADKIGNINDINYKWINLNTGNIFNGRIIEVSPNKTSKWKLIVTQDKNNIICLDSTKTKIKVDSLPKIQIDDKIELCNNDGLIDLNDTFNSNRNNNYGKWLGNKVNKSINSNQINTNKLSVGSYKVYWQWKEPNYIREPRCSNIDSGIIKIKELPNVNVTSDTNICEFSSIKLKGSPNNPSGYWSGSFNSGYYNKKIKTSVLNYNVKDSNIQSGTYHKLFYTYTDPSTQCNNTDTVNVGIQNIPNLNLDSTKVCISKDSLNLKQFRSSGKWIGNNVNNGYFNIPNSTGLYEITHKELFNNIKACEKFTPFKIRVLDTPKVNITTRLNKNTFCENKKSIQLKTKSEGKINKWVGYSDSIVQNNNFSPKENGPGNYQLIYYSQFLSQQNNCSNTDTISINIDSLPKIEINPIDSHLCRNNVYKIKSTWINSNQTPIWNDLNGDNNDNLKIISTQNNTQIINYKPYKESDSVILKAQIGNKGICPNVSDIIKLPIKLTPKPDFQINNGCAPLKVNINNKSIIDSGKITKYKWILKNNKEKKIFTGQNPIININEPSIWNVSLTTTAFNGCKSTLTKNNYLKVYSSPKINIKPNKTYTTIESSNIKFKSEVNGDYPPFQYKWFINTFRNETIEKNSKNIEYRYKDSGNYNINLKVTNNKGCISTDSQLIKIKPTPIVYAPNAFSPNQDNINSIYQVKVKYFNDFQLKIYDRWGENLYSSNNYETHGWNGKYKGEKVPSEAYMYIIKIIGLDGKEYTYSGTINLIR